MFVIGFTIWFFGSSNPETPAGYVGYLTQGSVFGKVKFYGLQTGPTSPGLTRLLKEANDTLTPSTYTEQVSGGAAVLANGNLSL